MNRKQVIDFCNKNIFPQVKFPASHYMDCFDVVKIVSRWRIGKQMNIEMVAKVVDGFLYINDNPLGRIAPKMATVNYRPSYNGNCWTKTAYNSSAAYWEGLILERQESDYD